MNNADMPATPLPNGADDRPYVLMDGEKFQKNHAIGLTKLEHFAGLAMQGILSNPETMLTIAKVSEGKDYKGSAMVASLAESQAKALLQQLEGGEDE